MLFRSGGGAKAASTEAEGHGRRRLVGARAEAVAGAEGVERRGTGGGGGRSDRGGGVVDGARGQSDRGSAVVDGGRDAGG